MPAPPIGVQASVVCFHRTGIGRCEDLEDKTDIMHEVNGAAQMRYFPTNTAASRLTFSICTSFDP